MKAGKKLAGIEKIFKLIFMKRGFTRDGFGPIFSVARGGEGQPPQGLENWSKKSQLIYHAGVRAHP